MKNYFASDYALNIYSEGIVYRFADGSTAEVTLEGYLAENPGKTEGDFRALKELSDSDYLEANRAGNAQTKKNVPLDEASPAMALSSPSPEDIHVGEIGAREEAGLRQRRVEAMRRALEALTDTQRRRYLMHRAGGLSTWEIAKREGVNQSKVVNSLALAEKKIKKVLESS